MTPTSKRLAEVRERVDAEVAAEKKGQASLTFSSNARQDLRDLIAALEVALEALGEISLGKLQADVGLPDSSIAWRMMRSAQKARARIDGILAGEGK